MSTATEKKPTIFETEPERFAGLVTAGDICWEQYEKARRLLRQLANECIKLQREGLAREELARRAMALNKAYRSAANDNEHPNVPRTGHYLRGGKWHWLTTDWYRDERGRQHARLYDHSIGAVDSHVEPVNAARPGA